MKSDAQNDKNVNECILIEKLKSGDKQAFEAIYYQYRKVLGAFAYQELKETSLAEDAVHDIFLKLWLKRATLDPSLSIKSYLFTCLKNHILNMIRTKKNRILKHIQAAQYRTDAPDTVEDIFVFNEQWTQFIKEVAALSARKRTILELNILEGLSPDEIAKQLNISANTVRIYLSQSTRHIKATLKE